MGQTSAHIKWGIHKDVNSWDKQSSRDQGSENSELKKPGNGWIDLYA
jgi:hypothetical protein